MAKTGRQLKDAISDDEIDRSNSIDNFDDDASVTGVVQEVLVVLKYENGGATIIKQQLFRGADISKVSSAIRDSLYDASELEF